MNLRRRREYIGLSQAELAEELGVSPNTIARWERGELVIGNERMLNLALDSLKTAGLRRLLRLTKDRLPQIHIAVGDTKIGARIAVAGKRLATWIEDVTALFDEDSFRRAIRSKSSFPGYSVLRRLLFNEELNPKTRHEISWATHPARRALELASHLWSLPSVEITASSTAKRRRAKLV